MLKIFVLLPLLFASVVLQAQWVTQRMPFHKGDFTAIAAGKYTMAFEYETTGDTKILNSVIEYGALGLPAGYYEKGTNDNGDSLNTTETIYKFDGAGRLIRKSYIDKIEGSDEVYNYSYAKDGKLQKKLSVHIDPTTTTYTYNAAGKVIKASTTTRMPAVDKNDEPTGKTVDVPSERTLYSYDKAGRLREETVYYLRDGEGGKNWSYKTQWAYNTKGQLIKLEHINTDKKVYNTETYEYKASGLLVTKTTQADEEPIRTFMYEYCTTCKQSWMD